MVRYEEPRNSVRRRPQANGLDTTAPTSLQSLQRLRAPSGRQSDAKAVCFCVAVLWSCAVILGALLHKEICHTDLKLLRTRLPLIWFDDWLRHYGALLPFPALILRWWGSALKKGRESVRPPSHFAEVVWLLEKLGEHVHTGHSRPKMFGVSGMIALIAMFTMEIALAFTDLCKALQPHDQDRFAVICIGTALSVSLALCIATLADMFYTALYFHNNLETFGGAILGSLLFQGPLAYWLVYDLELRV